MAKDKNFEARMQGMDYALRIAKEKGIDGLEKEIKMRTATIAPIVYSRKEVDHFWNYISMCNFNNIMTASVYTLHECFGFGKDRLKKFENHFGKLVKETEDLDYLGEHYVRLEDFAIEMNEKFDLNINIEAVAACTTIEDQKPNSQYHMARVSKIVKELDEAGFHEASVWLESKVEE